MLISILGAVCVICVVIATVMFCKNLPAKSPVWIWIVLFDVAVILGMFVIFNLAQLRVYENIAQETRLEEVFVKGPTIFKAEVEIIYTDGKLDFVRLISKTTKK